MSSPVVFIDTNIMKFSATKLRRFRPRVQKLQWGDQEIETEVNDIIFLNPNKCIANPKLKYEVEYLPLLAAEGKNDKVKYVSQCEADFESWGIPNMDSMDGRFYGTPIDCIKAPIEYSRVLVSWMEDGRDLQYDFLSGINNERFIEIQKLTGAYQGKNKKNKNQLLDAFHLWCAEHAKCDYFLTLDLKLIKMVATNSKRNVNVKVIHPSELAAVLGCKLALNKRIKQWTQNAWSALLRR